MHNLGLFVIQKNKKTMIKEKGKEICQRVLDTNYIIKEFEYQTSNAYSYCDSAKKTLDNTDNYANKMEELNQRREELEEAKNNTNIIFGIWDGIKNVN